METKSIGSFIAALRKANGLTQKALAEKLNISDKAVSRWERGESAPDLSLIPVIAEIFGVTSDELLRGERQTAERAVPDRAEAERRKTERQRRRIIAAGLSGYRSRSLAAAGLAIAGLIAAMVGNFGFHRAYIGFLAGAAFYLAACVCQAVFINAAFLSVSDDELTGADVERFKRAVVSWGKAIFSLTVVLAAISLPLIIYPADAYMGLTAETWLGRLALPFGACALALCAISGYFLTSALMKKGVYSLSTAEAAAYRYNFTLKRRCALALTALLLVTFAANAAATGGWDVGSVAEGTSFYDFESFKAYMEQDIPASNYLREDAAIEIDPPTYFDEQGREITEEQALRRTLTDSKGTVICEYIARNESVWSIRYQERAGSFLPITVSTQKDIYMAQNKINAFNRAFAAVYLLEAAGALLAYLKMRKKAPSEAKDA